MYDYLIIGQGLAGTLLAYFFEERGINFKIADTVNYDLDVTKYKPSIQNFQHPYHSASMISTGIINPVTGRRFVKSWMIDMLFPFAEKIYGQIEQLLNTSFYKQVQIYRTVPDQKAMNDFLLRLDDSAYAPFFSDDKQFEPDAHIFNIQKKGITIKQAAKICAPTLLKTYRTHLKKQGKFISNNIYYDKINIKDGKCDLMLDNNEKMEVKRIVFCEGYRAKDNPYFNFVPFTGTNGQTLIIESATLQLKHLLKSGIFVIPVGENRYQIGTTWDWEIHHPTLTETGYQYLLDKLDALVKVPYTIVSHQAAVRPAIKDRRPVLGIHPHHNNLIIFNGLGTKGVSLSPFFANHLVEFLADEKSLMKEVNIRRFI